MTRLPHENWSVEPFPGPRYKVGPKCCVPSCTSFADHAHHLWRRSHLGKDASWVILWDNHVVGNLVPLCFTHHELITNNGASIQYDETRQIFHWATRFSGQFERHLPLTYQPPVGGELGTASRSSVKPEELTADQEATVPCPSCGHRRKRTPVPTTPGERRARASWSLTVPEDDRERGADVLDELCEGVMEAFGREYHSSAIARYFAVVEAFAFVIQHRHLLVEEGA